MNYLSINQLKFAGLFFILTIFLNAGITVLLNLEEFTLVWALALLYGIPVFIIGWIFGKKDNETLPLAITGFKFHLITYIIVNGVLLSKHFLGLASNYEKIETVYQTIIFWGLGLLLHFTIYLFKKGKTIRGIKQSEIF